MTDPSETPEQDEAACSVGYKSPPKQHQFKKGQSGNPRGRPKQSNSIMEHLRQLLDGDQIGKNGEVVSRREAIVRRIFNDAMRGNQRSFRRFLDLLEKAGLLQQAAERYSGPIILKTRTMTSEELDEFRRNIGRPKKNDGASHGSN